MQRIHVLLFILLLTAIGGWYHTTQLSESALVSELTTLTPEALFALEKPSLKKYISAVGYENMLTLLDAADPVQCHDTAHIVGDIAYTETNSVPESLKLCSDQCLSGCIHGALLSAANKSSETHVSLDDFTSDLESLCSTDSLSPTLEGTCIHGVGHAVMSLSRELQTGLDHCDGYADEKKKYYCHTGVYMEYIGIRGERYDPNNVSAPCTTDATYPSACWRYQTGIISAFDPATDMQAYCEAIPDSTTRIACFHGLGRYAGNLYVDGHPRATMQLCASEHPLATQACVEGFAELLHDATPQQATLACIQLAASPDLHTLCTTTVETGLYSLHKDFSPYLPTLHATTSRE